MKLLSYLISDFNSEVHPGKILSVLEKELKVKLENNSASNPNAVHGFINTHNVAGEATVDIYFYEEADIDSELKVAVNVSDEKLKSACEKAVNSIDN